VGNCRTDRRILRLKFRNGRWEDGRLRRKRYTEDRFKGKAHTDPDRGTCAAGEVIFEGVLIVRVNGQEEYNRRFCVISQELSYSIN
jgi:hypothetical protein